MTVIINRDSCVEMFYQLIESFRTIRTPSYHAIFIFTATNNKLINEILIILIYRGKNFEDSESVDFTQWTSIDRATLIMRQESKSDYIDLVIEKLTLSIPNRPIPPEIFFWSHSTNPPGTAHNYLFIFKYMIRVIRYTRINILRLVMPW